jgi:hypothetical protein
LSFINGGIGGGYGGNVNEYYSGSGSYSITRRFTSAIANNNNNGFVVITANF